VQELNIKTRLLEFISHTDYIGDRFIPLLNEIKSITSNETTLQQLLTQANVESSGYAQKYISKSAEKGKKGKKASAATE
jgi:CRISPR-associated protein Csc2